MATWIITDTHLNHGAMVKYFGRPEDYQERIRNHWLAKVAPGDRMIHLGDVIFSRAADLTEFLDSLPATKELVRGNHDRQRDHWYLDHGFSSVQEFLVIGQIYLTHKPASFLPPGCKLNIHGHLHTDIHRLEEFAGVHPQSWHRLLAIECTDYSPVLLDEFIRTPGHFQGDL